MPDEEPTKQLQTELEKKNEEWQKELDDYDAESNSKAEQLATRHHSQIEKFEQYWASEENQRKYRKPTSELLSLWKQEKFLAKQGNFEEAKRIHQEAENLQEKEMQLAQSLFDHDYQLAKEKQEEKQAMELDSFYQERQHWRDILVSKQKNEQNVYENKKKVVDIRKKEPQRTKVFQNTTSRGNERKKAYSMPSHDFHFKTILPPLKPPNSKLNANSKHVNSDENDNDKQENTTEKQENTTEKQENTTEKQDELNETQVNELNN